MTEAQIRTAVHNIIKEYSTDTGALLAADNLILDDFITDAAEDVVLDLVQYLPESFLTDEDVTLVADTKNYTLTTEYLQIWSAQKNVSDGSPYPIYEISITDRDSYEYVGQTDPEPVHFYREGDVINFVPTPSAAVTNYAKFWLVAAEIAAMADAGPTYIPRVAHRLIVYKAAELIAVMTGDNKNSFGGLYAMKLKRVTGVLGARNQSQPRFLRGSQTDLGGTRERTDYDPNWR